MFTVGCHLSASKGFKSMGETALSIGANTFAFFTRNPRGGQAKVIDDADVAGLIKIMEDNNFGKLVAHAPYTVNPASDKEQTREFARTCLKDDILRMEKLPGNYYNFHPGSHVGQGAEKGIELISEILNDVLSPEQTTIVLLETMAGKGSEIGRSFEEIREIIDRLGCPEKVGVCLDSCHVSDGGYDIINDLDGMLTEFDKIIGLDKLKAMHLNDSMNPPGAHKDRHQKIGEGHLGLETFVNIINHPVLRELPFILETPNELDGYAREIALLRKHYAD